jgi:hypothetical protein
MARPSATKESKWLNMLSRQATGKWLVVSIPHVHVLLSGERSSQSKHPIRLNMISRQRLWYVKHRGILRVTSCACSRSGKQITRRCLSDRPQGAEESKQVAHFSCLAASILRVHVLLSGERSSQSKHPVRFNRISRWWLWQVKHRGILRETSCACSRSGKQITRRCLSDRQQGAEESKRVDVITCQRFSIARHRGILRFAQKDTTHRVMLKAVCVTNPFRMTCYWFTLRKMEIR